MTLYKYLVQWDFPWRPGRPLQILDSSLRLMATSAAVAGVDYCFQETGLPLRRQIDRVGTIVELI